MTKRFWSALVFCGMLTPTAVAFAAEEDAKTILCATTELKQCDLRSDCHSVTVEQIHGPRFIRVNLKEKTILADRADGTVLQSTIEHHELVDGKIVVQGAEDGSKEHIDGVGWTLTISKHTGRMSMAAAGEDVVFVGFGACTLL